MNLGGWGGRQELGGARGRKTVIRIYHIEKKKLFSIKIKYCAAAAAAIIRECNCMLTFIMGGQILMNKYNSPKEIEGRDWQRKLYCISYERSNNIFCLILILVRSTGSFIYLSGLLILKSIILK